MSNPRHPRSIVHIVKMLVVSRASCRNMPGKLPVGGRP